MEERSAAKSHKIILGNRRTGNFTGVRDVQRGYRQNWSNC